MREERERERVVTKVLRREREVERKEENRIEKKIHRAMIDVEEQGRKETMYRSTSGWKTEKKELTFDAFH